jgi:glycosyltransferase involved in cell wall biosynthesis
MLQTTPESSVQASVREPFEVSIVLPARDEARSLELLLGPLREAFRAYEIIVVNDGSLDDTEAVCHRHGVRCVSHPYPKGNGAAIKTGTRAAVAPTIVFMDADGQHRLEDIPRLLSRLNEGFDMVIGARSSDSHANTARMFANTVYNRFASWIVKHRIDDLTSGFRAVNAEKFREFLYLLPNGFSYPTTSTMAFCRSAYSIGFVPVVANKRIGKSHIRPIRDGIRFLVIMFRICTLFSPLRLFGPISAGFFLIATLYYVFTFLTQGRFTNMSALLYSTSIIVFLIGLVSEQITMLIYRRN